MRERRRGRRGVDPGEPADADVTIHLPFACKRFRHRLHGQVAAQEPGTSGVWAEGQGPHVRVQAVGADDDVELAGPPCSKVTLPSGDIDVIESANTYSA